MSVGETSTARRGRQGEREKGGREREREGGREGGREGEGERKSGREREGEKEKEIRGNKKTPITWLSSLMAKEQMASHN